MLVACSGKEPVKAKFSLEMTGMNLSSSGGLVIFGKNGTQQFSRIVSGSTVELELPRGAWSIGAVAWDGTDQFSGNIFCALTEASIAGDKTTVSLNLTTAKCFTSAFSTETGPVAEEISPQFCEGDVTSFTDQCDYDPAGQGPQKRGFIGSYRFRISSSQNFEGSYTKDHLESLCFVSGLNIEAGGSTNVNTLNIPAFVQGIGMNLFIDSYLSADCDATRGVIPNSFENPAMAKFEGAAPKSAFTRVPMATICSTATLMGNTQFASGNGSSLFPYVICNLTHLTHLQREYGNEGYENTFFILGDDINLISGIQIRTASAYDTHLEDGDTFVPIGLTFDGAGDIVEAGAAFAGGFDGNNHVIHHFRFHNNNSSVPTGFIWNVSGNGGNIANITFENAKVEGEDFTGIVAGVVNNMTVNNVHVKNSEVRGRDYVGGVFGQLISTTATDVSAVKVDVEGRQITGGLIGHTSSAIANALFDGWVYGSDGGQDIGGIVGHSISFITNSTSTGYIRVSGTNVGGIAGAANGATIALVGSDMLIKDLSAYGSSPRRFGGIVGSATTTTVARSFYTGKLTHTCSSGCGVGGISGTNLSNNMYTISYETIADGGGETGDSTINLDQTFDPVMNRDHICTGLIPCDWSQVLGDKPRLPFEDHLCENVANLDTIANQLATRGDTPLNPITICNPSQLGINAISNKNFKVLQNLNLADTSATLGNLTSNFDGDGNILYAYRKFNSGTDYALFNSLAANKTLKNLTLIDFEIFEAATCTNCKRSLLVKDNYGTIQNVEARDSDLTASTEQSAILGALVAENMAGGIISDSRNRRVTMSGFILGGIAGINSGTIQTSFSEAEIIGAGAGSNKLGGIAGISSGKIDRSGFSGSINYTDNTDSIGGVGGLVGLLTNTGTPPIIVNSEVGDDARFEINSGVNSAGLVGYSDNASNIVSKTIYQGFILEGTATPSITSLLGAGAINNLNSFAFHPTYKSFASGATIGTTTWNPVPSSCEINLTASDVIPTQSTGAIYVGNEYIKGSLSRVLAGNFLVTAFLEEDDCNDLSGIPGVYIYEGRSAEIPQTAASLRLAGYDLARMSVATERARIFNAHITYVTTGIGVNPPVWVEDPHDRGVLLFDLKD